MKLSKGNEIKGESNCKLYFERTDLRFDERF